MEALLILAARVEALQRDLSLATLALESDALRGHFRDSVRNLFNGFFQRKKGDLKKLAQELSESSAATGALAPFWTRFEQEADECDRLLKAYLAFIEGALVRSAGLDRGICDVADALLKQVAELTVTEWSRFTIVSDAEYYAPLTDIIQLRYPHFAVWNVPVLAHEFGHYVTTRLMDRLTGTNPLRTFQRDYRKNIESQLPPALLSREMQQRIAAHLDEFVADTFALYASGPAFACACLLLRFEPAHADEDSSQHPSDNRRAYVLLAMLEQRQEYRKLANVLRAAWGNSLSAAGRPEMSSTDRSLDEIAQRMTGIWDAIAPAARLSEQDWARAARLSQTRLVPSGVADVVATPRDILNAAWLARLSGAEADVAALNENALACFAHFGHAHTSNAGR